MEYIIREVTTEDAGQIAEIYNRYILDTDISFETEPLTVEQMQARIASIAASHPYYVATGHDGRILGYAYVHPWKERAAYYPTLENTVYLRPEAQGQGIGTRLMQQVIDCSREMGFHSIIACITASNAESIAFHRRLGFEQASLFRAVGCKHGRYHDVIDLQLIL